jgi:hypothetical protein
MGPITERFILGAPTAADIDDLPATQAVGRSIAVNDLEISFYFNRTVAIDCDLGRGH